MCRGWWGQEEGEIKPRVLGKCEEERLWALILILQEMGHIIFIINSNYYYLVSPALFLSSSSLFLPPTFPLPLPIFPLPIYRCLFTCAPLDPSCPSITLLLLGNTLLSFGGTWNQGHCPWNDPRRRLAQSRPSPYSSDAGHQTDRKDLGRTRWEFKAKTIKDISLLFFFSTRPPNI